jgi:hypothetical protein
MAFPDERDRNIIRRAELVEKLAADLCDWLSRFNPQRRQQDLAPIAESEEFEVLQLRRRASSLYASAKVPVAAAVYGPSQVGKSLFMAQVLRPHNPEYCPLGADENDGEPGYYRHLSFDIDLNPQCGSQEATALVTRFTTADRFSRRAGPNYPVMVRALTRAEWLRVLARGFHAECKTPDHTWQDSELEALFERLHGAYASQQLDRQWRMDILDAYSYMRTVDSRGFQAKEAMLNGLMSRYPLTEDGYVEAAAALFWDEWPTLTSMFRRINDFLQRITPADGGDPVIFTHWAGVRFLLDTQRAKDYERPNSKLWQRVEWRDMRLVKIGDYFVLDYQPGAGTGGEQLETIQAGMLEMVIPVIPARLSDDWRKVLETMDVLDIPGMRAVRAGVEQGKRTTADTLEEQMEIVKRGKVAYLFERYVDDLQIQTLLLLVRGGNLEVKAQMKYHLDKWGKARYGEHVWPGRVQDEIPALFIGLTGIDEEFRDRDIPADKNLYDSRLRQLTDALGPILNDFGGRGRCFKNIYPVRYPGTWDTNARQRQIDGPEKWQHARKAFLESEMVRCYVADAEHRWDVAMRDEDGGLSLISGGIRGVTSSEDKQNQVQKEIQEVQERLLQFARSWVVDPDRNLDRQRRIAAACKILEWLMEDAKLVYQRVHAFQHSLAVAEGEEIPVADCMETQSRRFGDPLVRQVGVFLDDWASAAVQRWEQQYDLYRSQLRLEPVDFGAFVRYLKDYLAKVSHSLIERLTPVVNLRTRDEAARRHARRKYTRMILTDFVLNPGPSQAPIPCDELGERDADANNQQKFDRFGLMASLLCRWYYRLPGALAEGAGTHLRIPAGNSELIEILEPFGR